MNTKRSLTRRIAVRLFAVVALAMMLSGPTVAPGETPSAEKPLLESISTDSGAPGTAITLKGRGFGSAKATSWVTFAGIKAKATSWSDTEIVAVVPTRTLAGYVGVTVANLTSNGKWFIPNARPVVTSISRPFAPPGTDVTIIGHDFGKARRTGSVIFGGRRATVRSWSDTRIVASVPNFSGPCYVGVWQGAPSNGLPFTPTLPPTIDGVSVTRVLPGQKVTLRGKRFGTGPGATVTLAGQPVAPTEWTSDHVTITVPDDAQTGYLGVWRDGACSNGRYLVVAPQIDEVSSWWGEPGDIVTVSGIGFGSKRDRVTLGGAELDVVAWTDSRIKIRVPADGEGYLGVWRGDGCSNGMWFLATSRPTIDADSVPSQLTTGQTVEISGSGFGSGKDGELRIGSTALDVISWSDGRIVATVPALADDGLLGVYRAGLVSNGVWIAVTH